jgi:arylsulfatase A-like enzyme
MADDLGYGDLSSYGANDLQSPHIDSLLSRGVQFLNFYANSPVCSPTRAALLSGRYQEMIGVPGVIRTHAEDSWGWMTPDSVLLPELLRKSGYRTALVGKWHLGLESPNTPTQRGFDRFHGFLGDMMDDYYNHRRHGKNYMRLNTTEIDPAGHATDLFTQWAVDYIRARRGVDHPFFLYLAYNAPHTPIQPPEAWRARVRQRQQSIGEKRAQLVALIEHMDDGVGKVVAALDEAGFTDNTIVVFTSDNGGQLSVGANNGPLRDGKQSVYEGGLKVPTCVVWPRRVRPAQSEFRAMSMDILPTLLDAAGVEVPRRIEGRSFLPALLGNKQQPLRDLWFFARREGNARYGGKTIEAVRSGPWKLLQNSPFQPLELYNLDDDPRETNDLSGTRRGKLDQLSALLRRQIQKYGQVPWQAPQ